MSGYNFDKIYCSLLSEDLFTLTNSVDPDEMQHYAEFYLVFTVCKSTRDSFRGFRNTKG